MPLFLRKFMGVLHSSQTGSEQERKQEILKTRDLIRENGKGNTQDNDGVGMCVGETLPPPHPG